MLRHIHLLLFGRLLLMAFFLISGCSPSQNDDISPQKSDKEQLLSAEILTVKEVPFEQDELIESFLYASKDAFVTAKIEGVLKEMYVDLGDQVNEGDTLAKIEDELLCLEFNLAKNTSDQLRHDYERFGVLYEKQLISKSEYEQARLKYKQAEIEEQLALERLNHSRLIAPFSGVVVSNQARIGQLVKAGDSLFHLTELSPVYSRVFLDEEQLTRLRTEGGVRIKPKYGYEKFAWGKIVKKSPIVDPVSGTVELIIRVDRDYGFLKPGQAVTIFLKHNKPLTALAIPKSALVDRQGLSSGNTIPIYIFQNGRALTRKVQLGRDLDSLWEIRTGLKAGDSIIVSGYTAIQEDQKVKPIFTDSLSEK